MANNLVQPGHVMTYTLGSGETAVASGKGILIGAIVGVVISLQRNDQTVFKNVASAEGDVAEVALNGVYVLEKTTGEAWTQGAKLYWNNTTKKFTTTASGNTFGGYANAGALSAATTGEVLLWKA